MLQHDIHETFEELSNVFHIADDILIVGYDADSKYHNKMLK